MKEYRIGLSLKNPEDKRAFGGSCTGIDVSITVKADSLIDACMLAENELYNRTGVKFVSDSVWNYTEPEPEEPEKKD